MKVRFIVGLAVLGVLSVTSISFASDEEKLVDAVIVKNVDGDTVNVCRTADTVCQTDPHSSDNVIRVRMIGIDAAELHLPTDHGVVSQGKWGEDSASYLASQTPVGTRVTMEDFGQDKFKRTLGRIYKQGEDINLDMVRTGMAVTYIICTGPSCNPNFFKKQHVQDYMSACNWARAQRLGIFDSEHPLKEMPFEFRLRMQGRTPDKLVGDYETKELYDPAEYNKVDLCRRIFFLTEKDAERAGFSRARLPR